MSIVLSESLQFIGGVLVVLPFTRSILSLDVDRLIYQLHKKVVVNDPGKDPLTRLSINSLLNHMTDSDRTWLPFFCL